MDFEAFPKIPRLRRGCVITEKIDGTNAAVLIDEAGVVQAQSRKRLLTPGKTTDNFGFAAWVQENAEKLASVLGPGRHFGEWWGLGVQRGYSLDRKRFSLFNVHRFTDSIGSDCEAYEIGLDLVPVLYDGPFYDAVVDSALDELEIRGSQAAPGFMKPEGIVVRLNASGHLYKVLLENDELPKGLAS